MANKLIHGFDPLCGWCFGFIPALKAFEANHLEVEIEIVPAGLFTYRRKHPYPKVAEFIRGVEGKLERITGRCHSEAFHAMATAEDAPLATSVPPTHAILQMKALVPGRVTEFACLLQEAHFTDGLNLNIGETYQTICTQNDLPELDLEAIEAAQESDAIIAESYQRAAQFGITSFPTLIIFDEQQHELRRVGSTYDPDAFEQEYLRVIA